MDESFYIKKRANPRVKVELKATFQIKGKKDQDKECRITDVSVSGVGMSFPRAEGSPIASGATVLLKIFIPRTVLHVSVQGEIMWAKQRTRDVLAGVKLSDILSATMYQQLQKKVDKK